MVIKTSCHSILSKTQQKLLFDYRIELIFKNRIDSRPIKNGNCAQDEYLLMNQYVCS